MTTVQEIKAAIEKLPVDQQTEIQAWLNARCDDAWDRQIAADAAAGRLDRLLEQVDADIDRGDLREFP